MPRIAKWFSPTAPKQKISILDGTEAYRELKLEVTKAGILKRSYGYYTLFTLFALGGFFLSLYELYFRAHGMLLLFWGVLFALFAVQLGGLLHDSGHRAIFKSTRWNDVLGFICGSILVLPYADWKKSHNEHHVNPNIEEEDPDLNRPIISFTELQARSQKGVMKTLVRYQVYIYYPLSLILFVFWQLSNVIYYKKIFSTKILPRIIVYIAGLLLWLVVPFFFFPASRVLLIDFIVYSIMGFYMYNIFAPNHKGMPQFKKRTSLSFLEHQILTARDINPNPITDFFYLGLNYQIEHHLFPNCPRNKLKKITPYVEEICRKMNLEFTSVGVIESNKIILGELDKIAKTIRNKQISG